MNLREVTVGRCPACGAPQRVAAYVDPRAPPRPVPSCRCAATADEAHAERRRERARVFDYSVIDAQVAYARAYPDEAVAARLALLAESVAQARAAHAAGNAPALLGHLTCVATIARLVATEAEELADAAAQVAASEEP